MGQILKYSFLLILVTLTSVSTAQETILDKEIKLKKEITKTGEALSYISRLTGFYFTYDSEIVDSERVFLPIAHTLPLKNILDTVFKGQALSYSIVQNHIILYRRPLAGSSSAETVTLPKRNIITGVITDFDSGEKLPFATIGLKNRGTGTISNFNGEFILNLSRENDSDTLSISYLGFKNRLIPVREITGNNLTIRMFSEYIPIPEIIIRIQDPQEIIRKARERIKDNYGSDPAILSGFYREGVHKKGRLQMVSEAVLSINKSSYTNPFQSDQIKVIKSRKIENTNGSDTLVLRLKGGLGSCLELDGVKSLFDFITPDLINYYTITLSDIVTIDDQNAYVIDFIQNPGFDYPLFEGSVYINSDNYAILLADFRLYPPLIGKSGDSFVSGQPRGYVVKPKAVNYRISYRSIGGRYFLNHVRGDLEFSTRKSRKIFSSPYSVFFELAITSADTTDTERFNRNEITTLQGVFSKSITGYDSEFWGDFNFLKPDEDLRKAVESIRNSLSEK